MCCRELHSYARLASRHYWKAESNDEDTAAVHFGGHLRRLDFVTDHDGDVGMDAGCDSKAALGHLGTEVPGVRMEFLDQVSSGSEKRQGPNAAGGERRGDGVRKEIGARALT